MRDEKRLRKQLESALPRDGMIVRARVPSKYRFDALRPYRPYPKLRRQGYLPTFLVRPETADQVAEIFRIARRSRTPVVPYGGGTGLMGAAIATHGGIMVDTSRMNRIEEVSREDSLVRAEAGVVQEDLFKELNGNGLLFAHDPWTRPIATLGGAISTNSLGYLGAKYGSIGDQLLGVEAVMPDGRLLKTRPAEFSSTGFDLKRLFIGTEGMFGLVTSAVVRAFPKPENFALAAYSFHSFEEGYRAICGLRAEGVHPCMVDYGEEDPPRGNALLNVAFDGLKGEVETQLRRASEITQRSGGKRLSDDAAQDFWDHRHDIALMYSNRIAKAIPDEEPKTKYDYVHISLPASKILDFRDEALQLAKEGGVKVLEIGLWHGPELLSLVLSSTSTNPRMAAKKLWDTSNRVIQHAQDLGGCMEFCHGVGLKLAHLMEREHGLGLQVMRDLKHAVDPLGILNPGKAGL